MLQGMFAKLSMTELRARQGVCSAECDTYHCYKGGPEEAPEGLDTAGCPIMSHPAQLPDNRNCVLCMECVKACPHRSIEFRWRLPAFDLVSGHTTAWHESCLMFMLLGAGMFVRCHYTLTLLLITSTPIHLQFTCTICPCSCTTWGWTWSSLLTSRSIC